MWRTSLGERVLRGSEGGLFRASLAAVWDLVEDSFEEQQWFSSEIDAFDSLQPSQKLAMLGIVGKALLDDKVPCPELSAVSEGTVAAVFEQVRQAVELEVEFEVGAGDDPAEQPVFWRELISAAYREVEGEGDESLPEASSKDLEEWDCLIECLADRILWDADFEMGADFLDADPDQNRTLQDLCRIPERYFLEIAPDPTAEQMKQIRSTLREITGRPEPEETHLVPGLQDTYHDLFVGPCDPEVRDKESACRLVAAVEMLGSDHFDCSYAEWTRLFRQQVRQAAAEEPCASPEPASILSPEQLEEAARAKRTGQALVISDSHRIEPREGGWVVVDDRDDVWIEVETCAWAADDGDPDLPLLVFTDPARAFAAYLRSQEIARARAVRRNAALEKLGRA